MCLTNPIPCVMSSTLTYGPNGKWMGQLSTHTCLLHPHTAAFWPSPVSFSVIHTSNRANLKPHTHPRHVFDINPHIWPQWQMDGPTFYPYMPASPPHGCLLGPAQS